MIKIESKKLSSEDCQILARITTSVRKGTPLESDISNEQIAANIRDISENEEFQILVALNENNAITGWIYYYIAIFPMAFINGFLPVVDQSYKPEKVAISLINASKKNIIDRRYSRLEIQNDFPTDAHRKMSGRLIEWYKKCGFQFAAEEIHMKTELGKIELPELNLPDEFSLRKFSEVPYEQLEIAGFQSLKSKGNDLFVSMNEPEQKVVLKYYFDKSKNFIEDSSLILEKGSRVVGFIITLKQGEEADIGPIGLIPEFRGLGLGNYLLVCALKNLKDIGVNTACLDMSISNFPAKKLYKRYGFETTYYKQFYYWSP